MAGVVLLVVIGTTIWMGVDASGRDWSRSGVAKSTVGWVLGSLLLWIVFFPLYLAQRQRAPKKHAVVASTAPAHTGWLAPAASSVAPPAARPQEFKRCPDCAEDIRAEARKCRFCGWTGSPA
jgi:hypothetical protein